MEWLETLAAQPCGPGTSTWGSWFLHPPSRGQLQACAMSDEALVTQSRAPRRQEASAHLAECSPGVEPEVGVCRCGRRHQGA